MRAIALAVALSLAASTVPAGLTWAESDRPGQRFHVKPADMPRPYATRSASNSSRQVLRKPGQTPVAPAGYKVNLFADGLDFARWLAVAPSGEVFLAEPRRGRVILLVDSNGDGVADRRSEFAGGHDAPHGLAVRLGAVYVADLAGVWRYPWRPGQREARDRPTRITPEGAFGEPGGHWTRNIAFSADGESFFVSIGSADNLAVEPDPRATIKRFDSDGSGGKIFARGLRNPVGIAFHPETGELYTVVNERDGMGDGLVPDYFTRVLEGGFYGWPYAYIGPNPQPGFAELRPDLVAKTIVPDVLFRSHSAPLGLTFAKGGDFPADWQDDAFVAFQGSWNAAVPTGYKVVRVPFEDGRPLGWYENFVTRFRVDPADRPRTAHVIGRPVGLAIAADGSLLIADATGDVIWRVSRAR
ncbi:MAG: PQQ-dependent sugar dehydrogenase [Alphaproteobacteria bacterium]|jgi:glucose/arabinose dehydrogenase|nr:PQQ-dependent sugar dehydrogenase [Alphaproteobacteria bacterium]